MNEIERSTELTAALEALWLLQVEVVDRCPDAECTLCGPTLPIAA